MDEERKLEEEILASYERGEWQSVPNVEQEIDRITSCARASLRRDKNHHAATGKSQ
ncbi:MAG: hypothetical protein HQL64_00975 [Magnetococcales bacterium]|nr:hypothetical protein [Magnetococcales bacterium]